MRSSFLKADPDDPPSPQQEIHEIAADQSASLTHLSPTNHILPLKGIAQSETVKLVETEKSVESPDDGIQSATPTNKTAFQYSNINNNISTESKGKTSKELESSAERAADTDDGFEENAATKSQVTSPKEFNIADENAGTKPQSTSELPEEINVADENTGTKPQFISELPEEISVVSGDCAQLDVVIEADPLPSVCWFKDGRRLMMSERISTVNNGSKYSLVINNARQADDAEYECRVHNDYGDISCFCELLCQQP